jgi:23S rRNA (adenine1618-N6)-methyltransferase
MPKHHHSSSQFNARMHPRNPYNAPINIAELARQFPDVCDHVISRSSNGRVVYDWHAPGATYAVTRALLARDFELDWQQPLHHLCPPVPGRLNYLLWLQDLVQQDAVAAAAPPAGICVADIGTGASAIFPLLGARRFGWSFVALDSSADALAHARSNVERNGLQHLITLGLVPHDGSIVSALDSFPAVTHTMCNPPFFSSSSSAAWRQRVLAADGGGEQNGNSVIGGGGMAACAALEPELFTEGGEVAFMSKIIQQSAASPCRQRVKWFTCMVGIKADLAALKAACAAAGALQVRTTTFFQGQTLRWGLAWTFVTVPVAAKRALERDGHSDDRDGRGATAQDVDVPPSKRPTGSCATLLPDERASSVALTDCSVKDATSCASTTDA